MPEIMKNKISDRLFKISHVPEKTDRGIAERFECKIRYPSRSKRKDPEIKTDIKGKPNAWNRLYQRASGEILIFMDADVLAAPNAFYFLCRALVEKKNIVAAGAALIGSIFSPDAISLLTLFPSLPIGCLQGRLYAVHKRRLARRLFQRGFSQMPLNLITEDLWLTIIIGRNKWTQVEKSIAYYIHPDFPDLIKTENRNAWGRKQLRREYKKFYREYNDHLGRKLSRQVQRLKQIKSVRRIWNYVLNRKDLCIIHLKRKNFLRSFLSHEIAMKHNSWMISRPSERVSRTLIDFDSPRFIKLWEEYKTTEKTYEMLFRQHPLLRVEYDELVDNSVLILSEIQQFLKLPEKRLSTTTLKQNPYPVCNLVTNFAELSETLRKIRCEWMLSDF